jgi:hypothetical protein
MKRIAHRADLANNQEHTGGTMSRTRFERAVDRWVEMSCTELVLTIVDFASPMSKEEIAERLRDNPSLAQLEVSSSRCDAVVRLLINRKIRAPRNLPRFPPGTIGPATTVKALIEQSCQ